MGLYRSLGGLIRVEYTAADVGCALEEIAARDITLFGINTIDPVTSEFTIRKRDWNRIRTIAQKRGDRVRQMARRGIFWPIHAALRRPVLLIGMVTVTAAALMLPGRILFVHVEGNNQVPARRIIEAADECGLDFGARRREVRSEQVKNYLLDAIPELKWAGVNTYGSRAVITVREREDTPVVEPPYQVRHIAASRDGIITSCTVTDGAGLCSVGQAVQKGDILISGYTDCGIVIRAEAAKGEVMAETKRNLSVSLPSKCLDRSQINHPNVKFSLLLGKKRINFYKGSGISGSSCVKMSTEYVLTLPGGFQLPVILVKETVTDAQLCEGQISADERILKDFAEMYLQSQMVSGSVITADETVSQSDEVLTLMGEYACIENIGTEQDEQIGDFNGKTNGTDRERGSGG